MIELLPRSQPPIQYEIAVVAGSKSKEAAETFVQKVLGTNGWKALQAAGFVIP